MAEPLIRLASEADAAAFATIYAPYVTDSAVSFEEVAPDESEMARRIAGDGRGLHPWLAAEVDGRVVGFASSAPFRGRPAYRWTVETGVYLSPDALGRGLGRRLMTHMLDLLTRQGFTTVVAGVTLPNPASIALHEALGFAPCATYSDTGYKLGAWRTVQVLSRDLAPRLSPPPELRRFCDCAESSSAAGPGPGSPSPPRSMRN